MKGRICFFSSLSICSVPGAVLGPGIKGRRGSTREIYVLDLKGEVDS